MPDDMVDAHLRGVTNALAAGWRVLERGGSALDAVEEAVVIMEDDETFDAGRGSFLESRRKSPARCAHHGRRHASRRRRRMRRASAQSGARRAQNSQREPACLFRRRRGGEVRRRARRRALQERRLDHSARSRATARLSGDSNRDSKPDGNDLFAPAEHDPTISHDTVGAVALDRNGNIAAATSTGGTLNKAPGRLGDSSLIGCGCYADNESAAASTTGWGEPIMKLVLAKWTADRISAGNLPEWSAQEAMNYLKQRVNGHGGIIVLNPEGHIGIAHNTPRMAWAYKTVKKQEAGIVRES